MTPVTLRRIVQEIRHKRELLTAEEKWLQAQAASEARAESFRRINFWRAVYADAEVTLGKDSGT